MRGEALPDHGFDLRPESRIAFAFHVAGSEYTIEPGSVRTLDWIFLVIDTVVSEDLSFGRIGGCDLRLAMNDAMRLIKVHRFGDVVGNYRVVLEGFCDAVHLNGQKNRYSFTSQVAGEGNGG